MSQTAESELRLATSYHNEGFGLTRAGKTPEALEKLQLCLDIKLRLLPGGHQDIAWTHLAIANALVQGAGERVSEAEHHAGTALAILQKVLPSNHPELSCVHSTFAAIYSAQGR